MCQNPSVPNLQVVCIPFAGSGASFFRNANPPVDITIISVQLPGREERFTEPPPTDVRSAADEIADSVRNAIDKAAPTVIFGHSLGAVLAFETARRLPRSISHLFVSGSPDPWHPRSERAADLTDSEFLDQVEKLAQYRHPALEHPEMREIVLPALRADVATHEAYAAMPGDAVDVPITALRGSDDRLVSEEAMLGWRQATSGPFALTTVSGEHMYLADSLEHTLELIVDEARKQRVQ